MASAVVLMCCVNSLISGHAVNVAREVGVALLRMMALSPDDASSYEFLRSLMKKRESEYVIQGPFKRNFDILFNIPLVGCWLQQH